MERLDVSVGLILWLRVAGGSGFLAPAIITDEMRARYPDIESNYEEVKEAAAEVGPDIIKFILWRLWMKPLKF